MKQKGMIIGIIIGIVIVVVFDAFLVYSQKKDNEPKNMVHETPKNEEDAIVGDTYLCQTNEKQHPMENGSIFNFKETYNFFVIENEIDNGEYTDEIQFKNKEDYDYFYANNIDLNNTYFTMEFNEKEYKITYKKNMILKNSDEQSSNFSDSYMDYLKEQGFICEKRQ